eukprot:ctg_2594.g579
MQGAGALSAAAVAQVQQHAGRNRRITVGDYTLAYDLQSGTARPFVFFLPGLAKSRYNTKLVEVEMYCRATSQGVLCADYVGTGRSSGNFADSGTISLWAEHAVALLDKVLDRCGRVILVGEGVGGWIALLATLKRPNRVCGIIGLAADPDFTEDIHHAAARLQRVSHIAQADRRRPSAYAAARRARLAAHRRAGAIGARSARRGGAPAARTAAGQRAAQPGRHGDLCQVRRPHAGGGGRLSAHQRFDRRAENGKERLEGYVGGGDGVHVRAMVAVLAPVPGGVGASPPRDAPSRTLYRSPMTVAVGAPVGDEKRQCPSLRSQYRAKADAASPNATALRTALATDDPLERPTRRRRRRRRRRRLVIDATDKHDVADRHAVH